MSTPKLALVTGASRGIGKEIATTLQQQGFRVIGTATSQQGADSISDYFALSATDKAPLGEGRVLNISDDSSIVNFFNTLSEKQEKVDVLVNNAGITADNLFLRLNENDWQKVIDTNLTGVYRMCKQVMRSMLKSKWGRIINITSVVAFSGNPGQSNYAAAKSGVVGFSKSLAQEIASRNITVNTVAPGFIETDMTAKLTDEQISELFHKIPMQKMGKPQDVAAAVRFLASDDAAYITGETIHVNGGMLMN